MSTPSRAQRRNADLRAALQSAWPAVTFAVRNGPHGAAHIAWTDGPTSDAVTRAVHAVPSETDGRPWATDLDRTHSPELVAVGYLRAAAAGHEDYLIEHDAGTGAPIAAGDLRPRGTVRAEWKRLECQVDAATITSDERAAAALTVALAQLRPNANPTIISRELARAVRHHGHVLAAVTGRPPLPMQP